ncbi:MAG TPA: hypothetical protein VGM25_01915 [Caulobacteraceae bacterium]|jgi:hypothetical protein
MLAWINARAGELADSLWKPFWQWELARPWPWRLALLLVFLLAGFCLGRPDDAKQLGREGRDAIRVSLAGLGAQGRIPLRTSLVRRVAGERQRLIRSVELDLHNPDGIGMTPWAASQAVVALPVPELAKIDVSSTTDFVLGPRFQACFCWTEDPSRTDEPRAMHISGWALSALAKMHRAPSSEELDNLLGVAFPDGSWPMFAELKSEPVAASVYATSWMLMGLVSLRDAGLVPAQSRGKVDNAIARAQQWLLQSRRKNGRWKDFPNMVGSRPTVAISALALHALHYAKAPDLTDLDHDWLQNLPPSGLKLGDPENHYTELGAQKIFKDTFAQFPVEWSLVATADAFPNGALMEKVKALEWIETVTSDKTLREADASSVNWWRAELLCSVNYLYDRTAPA